MIWRIKPSALLIGTFPDSNSFTAASKTSSGRSKPMLRYGESNECARCQFDASIASSCSPNIGKIFFIKYFIRCTAPARDVAHCPVGKAPHELVDTSARTSASNASSTTGSGFGQRSRSVFGGPSRFSSSKFQRPPTGSSPSIKTSSLLRCQR